MEIKQDFKAVKLQSNKITTSHCYIVTLLHCYVQKGFTLIEMVVATGVLVTVGMVASLIFFSTLRGVSKADITREVKQNGDYALAVIERMIRNSAGVVTTTTPCNGSSQTSLSLLNSDGMTTIFSLNNGKIASSGAFLTSEKVTVSNLSFVCSRNIGKPDVITVSFNVSQLGAGAGPEGLSSMVFQTTVSLRNY